MTLSRGPCSRQRREQAVMAHRARCKAQAAPLHLRTTSRAPTNCASPQRPAHPLPQRLRKGWQRQRRPARPGSASKGTACPFVRNTEGGREVGGISTAAPLVDACHTFDRALLASCWNSAKLRSTMRVAAGGPCSHAHVMASCIAAPTLAAPFRNGRSDRVKLPHHSQAYSSIFVQSNSSNWRRNSSAHRCWIAGFSCRARRCMSSWGRLSRPAGDGRAGEQIGPGR